MDTRDQHTTSETERTARSDPMAEENVTVEQGTTTTQKTVAAPDNGTAAEAPAEHRD